MLKYVNGRKAVFITLGKRKRKLKIACKTDRCQNISLPSLKMLQKEHSVPPLVQKKPAVKQKQT